MKLQFNANEVEPSSSFDPIPPGTYVAEITDSEERDTRAGDGSYLQLTFRIIEGEYTNRLIWDRLNLNNPNTTAKEIAQQNLSAICHAVNELNLTDSAQLHGKPMKIKVKVRPADGQYDASNEINGYEPVDKPVAVTTATAQSKPATSSKRPW